MISQWGTSLVATNSADRQFDHIFDRYGGFVFTIALALLKNRQDAEDALQEVFIRVHRAMHTYDEEQGNMEGWLRTILLNYCRDRWRKKSLLTTPFGSFGRNHNDEEDNVEEALGRAGAYSDEGDAPEQRLLQQEGRDEIWLAVNSLSEKLRRVVVLRYYIGLSCNEIADTLGTKEGTIHSRLHAARTELQRLLAGYSQGQAR